MYCDTTEEVCKSTAQVPLTGTGNTITNADQQRCATGFRDHNAPNGKKCHTLATIGCKIITRDHFDRQGNIKCPVASNFNAAQNQDDQGTCVRNANNVDVRLEGDLCGFSADGRQQVCGHNLACDSDAKCRKANDVGGECGTNSDSCLAGLQCVNHKCVKPYSLPDGAPCETNNGAGQFHEACASGYCGASGLCTSTPTNEACWRDIDCADAAHSVCVGATDSAPGKCLAIFGVARSEWLSCVYETCNKQAQAGEWSHQSLQECMTTGSTTADGKINEYCMKPYARFICAQYCVKRADERNPLVRGGDSFVEFGEVPFKFDCEKQTVTRLNAADDCNLTEQISNCEAVLRYRSDASTTSSTLRVLVGAVLLSVASVTMLL